jgi:hypothetical protein
LPLGWIASTPITRPESAATFSRSHMDNWEILVSLSVLSRAVSLNFSF